MITATSCLSKSWYRRVRQRRTAVLWAQKHSMGLIDFIAQSSNADISQAVDSTIDAFTLEIPTVDVTSVDERQKIWLQEVLLNTPRICHEDSANFEQQLLSSCSVLKIRQHLPSVAPCLVAYLSVCFYMSRVLPDFDDALLRCECCA